jgi:hypothetical protein
MWQSSKLQRENETDSCVSFNNPIKKNKNSKSGDGAYSCRIIMED